MNYLLFVCIIGVFCLFYAHTRLTTELINEVRKENYLLREQNKKLSDIITKYGIK